MAEDMPAASLLRPLVPEAAKQLPETRSSPRSSGEAPSLKALARKVLDRSSGRSVPRSSWDLTASGTIGAAKQFPVDPLDPPPAGQAPEWRRWLTLLTQHKEELGHQPALAARLAYGEALTILHLHHAVRSSSSCCAGCGKPVADPVHTLPDGAAVCPTDACLITHGEKWRTAAAAGLAALGIEVPKDSEQ
jgi:hypothetical protein